MQITERILALQRKQAPRSKQPPYLPHELRTVAIQELPAAVEQLLETTPLLRRQDLIEQLVRAVKSDDEDIKSRAWISLVSLGRAAIMAIGEQLLQHHQERRYRLRLIQILGEIGQRHREAMVPLLQILSTTKVPEVLAEARLALMRIAPRRLMFAWSSGNRGSRH